MQLPTLPIVPTARAAWLTALAAPVALLIAALVPGAWIVAPAAAAALLALVVVDALVAGRVAEWQQIVPGDVEVGQPVDLTMRLTLNGRAGGGNPDCAWQFDPRLGGGGRAAHGLLRDANSDTYDGSVRVTPNRRGTAIVQSVWLRWPGPLGLGAKQIRRHLGEAIAIWPDLTPVRSPMLQTFLRDAQFGIVARRIRGDGTQFEALSEYQPGMDRRRIDWKASARHTKLYARENESERNNQIVFAFDCGQAMCEPVDGLPRIDRAVSAALTAAYVALKGGDRVSLFAFSQRPVLATPFVNDPRAFHRLQGAAAGIDYHAEEPNFTLALATLTARLQRRSLIVLFSDFTDPTGAQMMLESLGRLVDRHLVLFVTIEDLELATLAKTRPDTIRDIATAVSADTLASQRETVLQTMRRAGIDVIEAPYDAIGYRLIDRYLQIKRSEAIG